MKVGWGLARGMRVNIHAPALEKLLMILKMPRIGTVGMTIDI